MHQRVGTIDRQLRAIARAEREALATAGRDAPRIRAVFHWERQRLLKERTRVLLARIAALYGPEPSKEDHNAADETR